jgi:hypothetical protein
LDLCVFLFHGQMEPVITDGVVGSVGRVAEDVLVMEFLVEVGIDFVESFFLRDFKETPAGVFGDLLENFFAVGARFLGAAGIAATSTSHSAAAHARSPEAAPVAVVSFLVSEKDAVDKGVRALRGFDCFGERLLAAAVNSVGEDDESLATLLFFHQFVGGEVDGVVEKRAAAVAVSMRTAAVPAASATGRTSPARIGLGELRGVDLIDGCEEFLAGRSEVLEEFDFVIEMDEEGFVFVFTKDTIEERSAGGAFLIEDAALAEAGVHEEAEGEREVGLFGEVGDGLGLAVLIESEVVFGEIADEIAVLVADSSEEIYGGDLDSDGRGLLGEEGESGEKEYERR